MKSKVIKKSLVIFSGTTLVLSSLISIGYFSYFNLEKDYIELNFGNLNTIILNDDQMSEIETDIIEGSNYNQMSYSNTKDDEEPVDPENPTTTPSTESQLVADWITAIFMQVALSGTSISNGSPNDDPITIDNYILSGDDNGERWIEPNQIDYQNMYIEASYIKLFDDTTGAQNESIPFSTYIQEFAKEDSEIAAIWYELILSLNNEVPLTYWEANESNSFDDLIFELSSDIEYFKEINNFLYVYSYLWQKTNSDRYDYYLTQQMVINKPVFLWELSFDNEDVSFGADTNINDLIVNANGEITNEIWNTTIENGIFGEGTTDEINVSKIHSNENGQLTNGGRKGYQGMITIGTDTSSIQVNNNLWSYDNVYTFSPYGDTESKLKFKDSYIDGISEPLMYQNLSGDYTQEVTETSEDGSTSTTKFDIYSFIQVLPFAFGHDFNEYNTTANDWSYSLVAYKSEDEFYYETQDDPDWEEVNLFNDVLFKDTNIDFINSESIPIDSYQQAEMYFVYKLFNVNEENKTSIQNSAYSYWKSRGFYIELFGEYDDKYSSLIPAGIQK